jgi:hypothetical protein
MSCLTLAKQLRRSNQPPVDGKPGNGRETSLVTKMLVGFDNLGFHRILFMEAHFSEPQLKCSSVAIPTVVLDTYFAYIAALQCLQFILDDIQSTILEMVSKCDSRVAHFLARRPKNRRRNCQ